MKQWTIWMGILCILFANCKDEGTDDGYDRDEQQSGSTVLECSIEKLTLDNDGNTKTFNIMSNAEWTIFNNSAWCKTDKTSGKGNAVVSVMAFPYAEYNDRNTNLTIKTGNKTKVI
ncbi:MAG: BACON domain-containing protein [Odoribacter sp.]|nr:BACON domain-containing protein [Odoribacter sp.]